ncbi:MAG: DUF1287 domain-containing protein [Robiginitomaculum sp.]|nr:MAG: DUF1287 domain-containing protein [Robiginitomaculum sp.]
MAQADASTFGEKLARAAQERTKSNVRYDGRYQSIGYPGGDVPAGQGVCTDVVIRSYRTLGIDLQQLVHEDMTASFSAYPGIWGLSRPDSNIDHRRVPNLNTYFTRQGANVMRHGKAVEYKTGDVLTWMLPHNLPHTGIVVATAMDRQGVQIVHNIGMGPQQTYMPANWTLTGQFRFGESD